MTRSFTVAELYDPKRQGDPGVKSWWAFRSRLKESETGSVPGTGKVDPVLLELARTNLEQPNTLTEGIGLLERIVEMLSDVSDETALREVIRLLDRYRDRTQLRSDFERLEKIASCLSTILVPHWANVLLGDIVHRIDLVLNPRW